MKLELKHIAPDLPYGLKLHYRAGYDADLIYLDLNSIDRIGIHCKPILRPLSDLTKEIEHNGEKFKPSHYISKHFEEAEDYIFQLIICIKEEHEQLGALLSYMPSCIKEKLMRWHFDVFGLIEKGLAIDKNTLK